MQPKQLRFRPHLLAVSLYSGLAFALFHRSWADPVRRVVGSCCDSATYVATFRFSGDAIFDGHDPLFSTLMHAPHGFNVMWQPNVMPLVGIVATPFESLVGPIATYDLVVTMGLVFSAWSCFVLLRRLGGGTAAPLAGGAFFGFSQVMVAHSLGHPQVTLVAFVPLMVLLAIEILVWQRRRWWVAGLSLGALAAAQLLVGEELLLDTAIACAALSVVLAVRFPSQCVPHLRCAAPALCAAVVSFAALAAAPLSEMLLGPQRIVGPIRDTMLNGTNLANLVVPNTRTSEIVPQAARAVQHRFFSGIGLSETTAYLGIPLLVWLLALLLFRRRSAIVQVTAATSILLAVLSLGAELRIGTRTYDVWLPWRLLHDLPPLQSIEPSRLWQLVDLGVAVLVAEGVRVIQSLRTAPSRIAGAALAVLVAASLLPSFHFPDWEPTVPRFFTTTAVDRLPAGSIALVVPIARGGPGDVSSQVWQAEAGARFAMIGGSVFVPGHGGRNGLPGGQETTLTRPLDELAAGLPPDEIPALTCQDLRIDRRELRSWGVDAVVVGPMTHRGAAISLLERVLRGLPSTVGGVDLWTGLAGS